MTDYSRLASTWAHRLPGPLLTSLIDALLTDASAVKALRNGPYGAPTQAALTEAFAIAKAGHGPYLAGLLTGFRDARRAQPVVTPVWTGPDSASSDGYRLTLAVVAGLIDEAQHELLLVSYATWPSTEVLEALVRATERGVDVTTLLERPEDNPTFKGCTNPLASIPHRALHWPAHGRDSGASMHAKILVVDRTCALVGSANLTGHGVERNIECGLLVRGGPIPAALVDHVRGLDLEWSASC